MDTNRGEQTVLLVADDPDILILAQAFLGSRYRVLAADDQHGAVRLLGRKDIDVHAVAIRAGMRGSNQVHKLSLERKAKPGFFRASVEDGIVHMRGLELAAVA